MNNWKCLVCGFIHKGENLPEKCPVCGAAPDRFEEVVEEEAPQAQEEEAASPEDAPAEDDGQEKEEDQPQEDEEPQAEEAPEEEAQDPEPEPGTVKKWKCTVCGYIHEGPAPPEKCPLCGADVSKFVELTSDQEAVSSPQTSPAADPSPGAGPAQAPTQSLLEKYEPWLALMSKLHAHPISVHIPNGVAPLAVAFLFLALLFQSESLATAYFYNMVAVLLSMPLVLFTGFTDWQRIYEGNQTPVFTTKMTCGAIVTMAAFIVVVWRLFNPEILAPGHGVPWLFVLLNLIMVGAAGFAGYQGGKLVFKE